MVPLCLVSFISEVKELIKEWICNSLSWLYVLHFTVGHMSYISWAAFLFTFLQTTLVLYPWPSTEHLCGQDRFWLSDNGAEFLRLLLAQRGICHTKNTLLARAGQRDRTSKCIRVPERGETNLPWSSEGTLPSGEEAAGMGKWNLWFLTATLSFGCDFNTSWVKPDHSSCL